MLKRTKRPVILQLDATVPAILGSVFIGKWSSFNDVTTQDALKQTGVEWFDKMFLNELSDFANPHPGEFLVPLYVPLKQLNHMIFFSQEDLDEANELLAKVELPQEVEGLRGRVDPQAFGRKMLEEVEDE